MSHPSDDPFAPPPAGQQPNHDQGPPAAQPQYGQNPPAPQYGQNPPAPQYGENPAPAYGQNPAQPYGSAPQYGAAPAYGQQPYPYAGGGYPGQPGYPAGPVGRPGTLIAASVLTWVGSAFGLLFGLIMTAASGSTELSDELDNADTGAIAAAGGLVAAFCVLAIVMAVFAFKGKMWATIVLTVLGGLLLLGGVVSLAQGEPTGVISIAWIGAAIGMFWATPSREYYKRS